MLFIAREQFGGSILNRYDLVNGEIIGLRDDYLSEEIKDFLKKHPEYDLRITLYADHLWMELRCNNDYIWNERFTFNDFNESNIKSIVEIGWKIVKPTIFTRHHLPSNEGSSIHVESQV